MSRTFEPINCEKKECLKQSFGSIYRGLSGAKGHFLIRAHSRLKIIAAVQFKKHASFGPDQDGTKVCGPRKTGRGGETVDSMPKGILKNTAILTDGKIRALNAPQAVFDPRHTEV